MERTLSRRAFVARSGALGLGLGALSSAGLFTRLAGATTYESGTGLCLDLPPYPFFPNLQTVMTEDRPLLEKLLRQYERETPEAERDPIDFLSGFVPAYVFERSLRLCGPEPTATSLLWLMHLAGYFGGLWLRDGFIRFPVPGSPNPRPGLPPTEAGAQGLVDRIRAALDARAGSDADVLAYVEASLRGAQLQALVDSFGYNAGYLDQILNGSRPAGATAPPGYLVYDPTKLFDATYGVPEIGPLARWRQRAAAAAAKRRSRWNEIVAGAGGADDLVNIQVAAVARGKATWAPTSTFLGIANFDQPTYDLLLSTSAGFLQAFQATGLASIGAASLGQAAWARAAALSNAMAQPFAGSYALGLFDPAGQLPTFSCPSPV